MDDVEQQSENPNEQRRLYTHGDAAKDEAKLWVRYFFGVFYPILTAIHKVKTLAARYVYPIIFTIVSFMPVLSVIGIVRVMAVSLSRLFSKTSNASDDKKVSGIITAVIMFVLLVGVGIIASQVVELVENITDNYMVLVGISVGIAIVTILHSLRQDSYKHGTAYIGKPPTVEYTTSRKFKTIISLSIISTVSTGVLLITRDVGVRVGDGVLISVILLSWITVYLIPKTTIHNLRRAMKKRVDFEKEMNGNPHIFKQLSVYCFAARFHPFFWNALARVSLIGVIIGFAFDIEGLFLFPSVVIIGYLVLGHYKIDYRNIFWKWMLNESEVG